MKIRESLTAFWNTEGVVCKRTEVGVYKLLNSISKKGVTYGVP